MLGLPFIDRFYAAIKPTLYDDVIDRLNYYVTTMILIFFTVMVSAKQYIGSPIQCWFPAQFKGGWEQYAEDFCFVQNTYFLPIEAQLPTSSEERKEAQIGYYQWVPVVLALEAMMFYLPHFLWSTLNTRSGVKVESILLWAQNAVSLDAAGRSENLKKLANYIEESIRTEMDSSQHHCHGCMAIFRRISRLFGSYVCCLYVAVKGLYVVNVVSQFFLLNAFLSPKQELWGYHILSDIIAGRNWNQTGHFPRVTMCDFKVREVGNTASFSVQCVLMINLFNEKIFLFVWFWLWFVAICTCVNFLYWLFSSCNGADSERLISRYLRTNKQSSDDYNDSPHDRKLVRKFTRSYLRSDGVLILKFVSANIGDMVATELIKLLFDSYKEQCKLACLPMLNSNFNGGLNGDGMKSSKMSDDGEMVEGIYPTSGNSPLLPSAPNQISRRPNGYPGPPPLAPKPQNTPVVPV